VVETGRTGIAVDIVAGAHTLKADEPEGVAGGTDRGPDPYALLLASLGACTAMTLRLYADRKGIPLEAARVRLSHERVHAEDCAQCDHKSGRVDRIERQIELVGPLDDEQRKRLLEIADRCPVHRTLTGQLEIHTVAVTS